MSNPSWSERREFLASVAASGSLLAGCGDLSGESEAATDDHHTGSGGTDTDRHSTASGTTGGSRRDGADEGVGWLVDNVAVPETGADVQTAIDAVEARGYVALRPNVTYEIDDPLTWPNTRDLQGLYMGAPFPDGRATAEIRPSDDFAGDALVEWHGSGSEDEEWNFLRDVGLFGLDLSAWGDVTLVDARNVSRARYRNVYFRNTSGHGIYNEDTWDARYHDCAWNWLGDDDADRWAFYAVDGCNTHFFEGCRWEGTRGGFVKTTSRASSPDWKKHSSYFFDRCKFHGNEDPADRVSVPHFQFEGRWGDNLGFNQCVHVWPPTTGIRVASDDVSVAYFSNVRWLDSKFEVAPVEHTETAVEVHGEASFQGCTAQGIEGTVVDATDAERVYDAGTNDFEGTFNDAVAFADPNDRVVYVAARGTGSGPVVRDERTGDEPTLARLGGEDDTLDVGRGSDGQFRVDNRTTGATLLELMSGGGLRVNEGGVQFPTRASDPDPSELPADHCSLYLSDGPAGVTGTDGDVVAAVNRGGDVKTSALVEF